MMPKTLFGEARSYEKSSRYYSFVTHFLEQRLMYGDLDTINRSGFLEKIGLCEPKEQDCGMN